MDFKDFDNLPQIDYFNRVGGPLGSNAGGVYENGDKKYYIKHQQTNDHAHNEVIASKLYQLAGSPVIDSNLIHLGNGKLGTYSKMEKLTPFNPGDNNDINDIHKHFGTHVWTGNWDTVGLVNDNQARDTSGNMKTIDVGGALKYRAQGGPKGHMWSEKPTEHNTFKNPNINYEAAHVFAQMHPDVEKESIKRIKQIPDEDIRNTVYNHHGDNELANTLIARKNNM